MPTISRVSDPKFNLTYGWMFDISNYDDLRDYFTQVAKPRFAAQFIDAAQSYEVTGEGSHAREGAAVAWMAGIKGCSALEAAEKLQTAYGVGLDHVLRTSGRIFLNAVGGYFGFQNKLEILETKKIPKWVLPSQDARIIQWPNGAHFYAKVGDVDVVVDGKQKWDTRADAEAAAKKFMSTK